MRKEGKDLTKFLVNAAI